MMGSSPFRLSVKEVTFLPMPAETMRPITGSPVTTASTLPPLSTSAICGKPTSTNVTFL